MAELGWATTDRLAADYFCVHLGRAGDSQRSHTSYCFSGGDSVATVVESRAVRPLPLRWRKGLVGELWAEFFGCFILISFGDGVVAMLWALIGSGRSSAGALQSSGDWLLITWGWALAVVF